MNIYTCIYVMHITSGVPICCAGGAMHKGPRGHINHRGHWQRAESVPYFQNAK